MDELMVSVIILTYNHEKYIAQAIESVLSQKADFRFEILISDDASADGTADIVREYGERYPDIIRTFIREKNLGPTRNGYETLVQARGKYLASCEGDDYWTDPQKLQKQVDFLEANPEFAGVATEMEIVDENGSRLKNQKLSWISPKRHYTLADFRGIFLPGHPNTTLRRNLLLNPDFDGTVFYKASPMIGDRTNAMVWACYGDFYRLEDVTMCYRQNLNSMTKVKYVRNKNRVEEDFRYTRYLHSYAAEKLGKELDFDYHYAYLYSGAFLNCLCRLFTDKAQRRLMGEILSCCKSPAKCIANLFPWCLCKVGARIRNLFTR